MTEPDLYALVLQLRAAAPGSLTPDLGHQAQGLFLDLVAQVDAPLATALHDGQHPRAYTIAPLRLPGVRDERRGLRRGDGLDLRVTLLRPDLFGPVVAALLQQSVSPTLRLGQLALSLGEVRGTPGSDPWAGYSSWAALCDGQPVSQIELHFATPTQISQGEDTAPNGKARPRVQLFPLPEAVWGSLARRWNTAAPKELGFELSDVEAAAKTALVAEYELRSAMLQMGQSTLKGFVGRVRYELRGTPEQRRVLAGLADAAFYLGVGAKTARGMGLCRRVVERGQR